MGPPVFRSELNGGEGSGGPEVDHPASIDSSPQSVMQCPSVLLELERAINCQQPSKLIIFSPMSGNPSQATKGGSMIKTLDLSLPNINSNSFSVLEHCIVWTLCTTWLLWTTDVIFENKNVDWKGCFQTR